MYIKQIYIRRCKCACATHICTFAFIPPKHTRDTAGVYGVATISRLLKITGLFCKRAL